MSGGDFFAAQGPGVPEKPVEFYQRIAMNARIGGLSRKVFAAEGLDNNGVKVVFQVDRMEGKPVRFGNCTGGFGVR